MISSPAFPDRAVSDASRAIRARPVNIEWHNRLPVFAKESFLRAVGDECGWLGGFVAGSPKPECVLPYTVIHKAGLRLVRFRVETIALCEDFAPPQEKEFLNSVVAHFRQTGADVIIPATSNSIFRTFPAGAEVAPYGSYFIDLRPSEETLWHNIDRVVRQNINTARRNGVTIRDGMESLDAAYDLIRETFARSRISFMDRPSFQRLCRGLGAHARLMVADLNGIPESYCLFAFSDCCAYAIYAGNRERPHQGANKLLYWEAIRHFRSLGVAKLDFYGARINPEKGSKQDAINALKRRFGASLKEGYLWKCTLRPWRSRIYTLAVRLLRGGDIVDCERKKLAGYSPAVTG